MREKVENPPELTAEDERLLDKAWAAVREWKAPKATKTPAPQTTVLGWGKNK
jgi:hypothetical protein